MNILLIYPDISEYSIYRGIYYSGMAYLSAVLKNEKKFNVSFLHLTKPPGKEDFLARVKEANPHLIAFSATTNMYHYVRIWADWISGNFKDIKIICGGVHPTIAPEEVIQNPAIDIICRGEGEYALLELCNRLSNSQNPANIEGLWVKEKGNVYRNRLRGLIEDLNSLPFPDRSIFNHRKLHFEDEGRFTVMVSRGCPYSCAYCCNSLLREICSNGSNYVRFRSVDNAIYELKQIISGYPNVKSFSFDDDILPLNKVWFKDFSFKYNKEIGLPYSCNLRPNLVDKETVDLLKYSGCVEIRMGIESGNDYMRNKVLLRNISQDQLVAAFKLCKEAGLGIYAFNMIGFPYESLSMMLETVEINAKLQTDTSQVTIFYPYQNTQLYDFCNREGLIDVSRRITECGQDTMLKFDVFTRNRVIFIQRFFRILVKLYAKFDSMHWEKRRMVKSLFAKIVFSPLSSLLFLPSLSLIVDIVWKNRFLSLVARRANRVFLKG